MLAVSHWSRLIDYLNRMGTPLLIQNQSSNQSFVDFIHGKKAPLEYVSFVENYGFPTLYIDDDMCLGFLSPEQSLRHPLYHSGLYPFAVCSSDLQICVVLEYVESSLMWQVVVYEELERVDVDGDFATWMKAQVRQFLIELSNYDFHLLRKLEREVCTDPLSLNKSFIFSLTS